MPKKKKEPIAHCRICKQVKLIEGAVLLPNKTIICKPCREKYKDQLKVFRVGCFWQVIGHFEIPARNLEEAIAIANDPDSPLPPDPDFVPDSFKVDPESCEEMEGEEI